MFWYKEELEFLPPKSKNYACSKNKKFPANILIQKGKPISVISYRKVRVLRPQKKDYVLLCEALLCPDLVLVTNWKILRLLFYSDLKLVILCQYNVSFSLCNSIYFIEKNHLLDIPTVFIYFESDIHKNGSEIE